MIKDGFVKFDKILWITSLFIDLFNDPDSKNNHFDGKLYNFAVKMMS